MNKDMKLNRLCLREILQGAKSFLLMIGIAIAVWAIAIGINEREQQRHEATENETVLTTHLTDMARSYYLLHSLRPAENGVVSRCLSFQLADDIRQVRAAARNVNVSQQAFAERLCSRILRDKQWHPDYYVRGSTKTRSDKELAWKTLEDDAIASAPASDGER